MWRQPPTSYYFSPLSHWLNDGDPQARRLAVHVVWGYTPGMKTAVSIPDAIFKGAERLARRTRKSRSRLFSEALKEYLVRHSPDEITEAMNKACIELGEDDIAFVTSAARRVLKRSKW
jgi:predicted transcriptional regulator